MNSAIEESSAIIAPPPILYLGALMLGLIAQGIRPWTIFPAPDMGSWLATVLIILSAGLARWSFVSLRRIGTTANPRAPSQALAVTGPFHWSRNPIYLAMTGLYLGATLIANAYAPLLLLVPLWAVMHFGVIRREERYLARQFGADYVAYASTVRRWI
ncbi:isoprenylcysteine carboxylmethyltransferase family protein [Halothiobacillus sp.]|uniref:methyltransferase family protein n=1 Tax=Halothiobacillus sp. TaxID=1891311 RepID=UPI002AD52750|nr:isoprenylcysteine carboxylmethyltransferase family protein [Halothiobacillus sp.]